MVQQVLLDVWEFLTSSQRRPKSLVQESLQGNKPSPRCSNSLACCNGASARGAAEPGRRDGLSPAPLSTRGGKGRGGQGPGKQRRQPSWAEHRLQPQPQPRTWAGAPWLRCQGRAGQGTDLLPRAAGRAVQPLAQRTAQALDPGVVPDGFQGCPQELQERTGEEANASWPLTSRKRQCQGTRPRQSGLPRELWPVGEGRDSSRRRSGVPGKHPCQLGNATSIYMLRLPGLQYLKQTALPLGSVWDVPLSS